MSPESTEDETQAWVASLLQISDPLFPTGTYAHSMGLEQWAATQQFKDADDLAHFLMEHAGPALARLELPYLRFLRQAFEDSNWTEIQNLDEEIDAWKWSAELREASAMQGRGRLRLMNKLWPDNADLSQLEQHRKVGTIICHHLVVSALQFNCLAVPAKAGLFTFGYQSFANFASASIKLLRISPEAAQTALALAIKNLPLWVEAADTVSREDAGWFAPAFDIESARHATAFSRLFIS